MRKGHALKNKIIVGEITLYLGECPQCGYDHRTLNEDTLAASAALTGAGLLTTVIFGGPLFGALGAIGLTKLLLAGTISGPVWANAMKGNYTLVKKLSEMGLFECPKCHCNKLLK